MANTIALLDSAGVIRERFGPASPWLVHVTAGNQLMGTHRDLTAFAKRSPDYRSWQSHHIVECHDLVRLNIATQSPERDDQLCVLLPAEAHLGRINSILRNQAPIGGVLSVQALLAAYSDAYATVGDYCGGGERKIRRELLDIVRATFRSFQLI